MRADSQSTTADLKLASYSALSALIQNSCPNSADVTFKYLIPVLQELEKTIGEGLGKDKKNIETQDYLCSIL
jgi:hypothetical protein